MNEPSRSGRWLVGYLLLLAMGAGCVDTSPIKDAASVGGQASSSGGASGSGGSSTAPTTSEGGSATAGTTFTTPVVPRIPGKTPEPPTRDIPQPSAAVTTPNLKVLPWAGFTAAVSYTFDDSQPSQSEHWEALKATGVPMTFFANPSGNWQSGYDKTWTAIAAAGSEIGNHTWSHCCPADLSDCTNKVGDQNAELDQANTYFAEHMGVANTYSFASPCGDAGWSPFASSRFLAGRGVMSGLVPASGVTDWYNLPVFQVAAGQTQAAFNASIDSARVQGKWDIFMFHSILPTTNNWFAGVDISAITTSLAYANSLGDVWLDTFVAVAAYARAEQMFEALRPNNNTWTWSLPDHFPPGKVLRITIDGGSLSQNGQALTWDAHGYYEADLDAGNLTWSP